MMKKVIFASLLLAICAAANAAEPKSKGFYVGASYGVSTFDDDGLAAGLGLDDQDTMAQIVAGYKFLKYFSIEARYADLGTFGVPGLSISSTALSAHAVGIIPFGSSGWEVFGQLGYGDVEFKLTDTQFGSNSDTKSAGAGGIGVRWHITNMFSLSAQTDVYVFDEEDFGETYNLAVGGTTLGIQLTF